VYDHGEGVKLRTKEEHWKDILDFQTKIKIAEVKTKIQSRNKAKSE
jgi:hypothetical protein